MDETDKEMRLGFESVTRNNVQACIAHNNETRIMVRAVEARMDKMENNLLALQENIKQFRVQLAGVQTQLYKGGT